MTMFWSSGGTPLCIINLGTRSALHPGHFANGKRAPGTHWLGGWVGPRAALDTVAKRRNSCTCQ